MELDASRGTTPASTWTAGSFLGRLAGAARVDLLSLGVRGAFSPGQRLMREGDRDSHVAVIHRGFVKVTTIALDGLETLLAVRAQGDVVGELSALSGHARSATVTACGKVIANVMSGRAFQQFLARYPDAARHLVAVVGERLMWANRRRIDITSHSVNIRLCRVLSELALTCGQPTAAGTLIAVTLTQSELASMVSAAEASVHSALRDLRQRGLIVTGYRRITVVDAAKLEELGHGDRA